MKNARKTQTEKKKKDENETRQRLIVYGNLKYRKTGKKSTKRKKKRKFCRPATMIKNFSRQLTLQKIVGAAMEKKKNIRKRRGEEEKKRQPCQATTGKLG